MAQKRMFDRAIIDTDRFMDLSMSAKALYFLLGMEADDEGFVSYKKVMRIHGGNEDDVKILAAKKFIIAFKSGVVVVTDWNCNNYLNRQRIKKTEYQTERKMLDLTKDNKYELNTRSTSIEESSIEESKIAPKGASPPKISKKDTEKDQGLDDYVKTMRESPQRHIRLIGEYADQIKPTLQTVAQWRIFTNRNLRVARDISPFTDEQISVAMTKLEKDTKKEGGFITKWTLETLLKYLLDHSHA